MHMTSVMIYILFVCVLSEALTRRGSTKNVLLWKIYQFHRNVRKWVSFTYKCIYGRIQPNFWSVIISLADPLKFLLSYLLSYFSLILHATSYSDEVFWFISSWNVWILVLQFSTKKSLYRIIRVQRITDIFNRATEN